MSPLHPSLVLLSPILFLKVVASVSWTVGQAVNTTSGVVSGRAAPGYPDVSQYLGIPFGESTAGYARFLPPKPYYGTCDIDGSTFGPACPQSLGNIPLPVNSNQSEDCLNINVWTAPQTGESAKAVMLWIYGGAFVFGDGSNSRYNGAVLANNQDVVVVNFNYRVGIFGFPGAPGLEQQNPGLLDQRLAVEWVRDNIAAFGGDPDRITLFGESAGAFSVDLYAYAWTADPIVAAFIEESGDALREGGNSVTLVHPLDSYTLWYNTSKALGCGGKEDGAATVACVREYNATDVLDAVNSVSSASILAPAFTPWIDEQTTFSDVQERAKNGLFIRKPLLGGSNYNESLLFIGISTLTGEPLSNEMVVELNNEFRCGARDSALARSLQGVPSWRYLFANNSPLSNIGATHGDEVDAVFGNGQGLSALFQDAWGAFAKDPINGLDKFNWPQYTATGDSLILIAPNETVSVQFISPAGYDQTCPPSFL